MANELLIAMIAGIGGMFGWGFADFAAKKTVDKIGAVSSLVWAHVFGTSILLVFVLLNTFIFNNPFTAPFNAVDWIGLVFFGTLQTVVYLFVYKGFEKGKVSILSPILASYTGLVALLSVIVFGEVLKVNLIPALFFIFSGVLLINLDPAGWGSKRISIIATPGIKEIAIATVLATIWTLGWDNFTSGKDWVSYTFLMYAFMALSAYGIAKFQKIELKDVKKGAWPFLWLIGLGEAIAYLAISLGYANTSFTSVIALLSGAFSLPVIILAVIFLKEKITKLQIIGALIVITGIILISL